MGARTRTLIPSLPAALLLPVLTRAAAPAPAPRPAPAAVETPSPEQVQFFETKIRPVLAEECFACHSSQGEKIRGGLGLENRAWVFPGHDAGVVVVPGTAVKCR